MSKEQPIHAFTDEELAVELSKRGIKPPILSKKEAKAIKLDRDVPFHELFYYWLGIIRREGEKR